MAAGRVFKSCEHARTKRLDRALERRWCGFMPQMQQQARMCLHTLSRDILGTCNHVLYHMQGVSVIF